MKTLHLLLAASFMLASTAVSAKTLEVTVSDIRNDKGNILGMAAARAGKVVVTLEGIEADAAELSLFHDEDGDYKMKMGERGPAEGYATRKCKLPAEHNTATLKLYYPATENE